jgi:hypothetical protein
VGDRLAKLGIKEESMKAIALILALGVLGISPFLWGRSAEAQTQLPQKQNPCAELRLEIEGMETVDISTWPAARVLLGLFCAYQGDPRTGNEPNIPGVRLPEPDHLDLDSRMQPPADGQS